MGMQLDRAQVDYPGEACSVIHYHLFGGAPRRERQNHGSQPLGPVRRRPLLVKRFAFRAIDKTFQHERAVADSSQRTLCHRKIVLHQV